MFVYVYVMTGYFIQTAPLNRSISLPLVNVVQNHKWKFHHLDTADRSSDNKLGMDYI